jgi:RND family efflux transporter MFP subunit
MNRYSIVVLLVLALLAGGLAVGAVAQSQALDPGELDCVIEPRSVVKVGSAERGILAEIKADRGAIVKKGDAIARLNSDLEALAVESARVRAERDVDVRSNSARYEFKKQISDRSEELFAKNIGSAKAREEAIVDKQLAEYAVAAAKTDLVMAQIELKNAVERLERRTIRSSVDGVVVQVSMAPGEFVQEQTPIMTLAQIDPLYVEMFVPISRYGTVSVGMSAKVMPEAPVGGTYVARVQIVDRVFDTASGTFGVRLELPNPDYKLPAGLKCRTRFLPLGQ